MVTNTIFNSWKNAFILMRIPFSFFLMPVFFFAMAMQIQLINFNTICIFLILHIFIYPASNGYNSLEDKDTGSIGGLKNPPKVNQQLVYLVYVFDFLAVAFSLYLNTSFGLMVLIYLLVSKAYSFKYIRLKKYAWLSFCVVVIFQGWFTYAMILVGLETQNLLSPFNLTAGVVSSLFLSGSYPLTQVYQHEEDKIRGDKTLSLKLGIKGTFIFSGMAFGIAIAAMFYLFKVYKSIELYICFLVFMLPTFIFFNVWANKVWNDNLKANFKNTMRLNMISSLSFSLGMAFIWWKSL